MTSPGEPMEAIGAEENDGQPAVAPSAPFAREATAEDETGAADPPGAALRTVDAADNEIDDLAAAWGLELDEQASAAARSLSQNEIDSLLGVTAATSSAQQTGIAALLDRNDVTYERLPMLEVIFDRLERLLTTTIRTTTAQAVDVDLKNIAAYRFGDYLDRVPLPAMLAIVKPVPWEHHALVMVDSALIYTIVDLLLGGKRGQPAALIEGRPYTTIETSLIERLIKIVLKDLSQAFTPLADVDFRLDRIETNPRFAAIVRPTNACVVFRMRVRFEDRGGNIDFVMPYVTLEPIRDQLLQMFMGEKFGRDMIWETHLARQVLITDLELEALLDEQSLPLAEVMRFAIGTTLELNVMSDDPILLRSGGVPIFKGHIGRSGERMSVVIDSALAPMIPIQKDAER